MFSAPSPKNCELDSKYGFRPGRGGAGRGAAAAAGAAPKPKKGGGFKPKKPKSDDEEFNEVIEAIIKLLLRDTQAIADLQASTYKTAIAPADSESLMAGKNEAQDYMEAQKDHADQIRGPPHIHIVSEVIFTAYNNKNSSPASAAILKNFHDLMVGTKKKREDGTEEMLTPGMSVAQACEAVPHYRVSKTFDSSKRKVQFLFKDSEVSNAMMDALVAQGAMPKFGRPVKGHLERFLASKLKNNEATKPMEDG